MEDQIKGRKRRSSTFTVLQDRTSDLTNTGFKDSGSKIDSYYETNMSPFRYKLRSWLLPLILKESQFLYDIQKSLRCSALDIYFPWTANLGSHTFYVLMLPLPLWFGYCQLGRDLVFILGFGIFFSGWIKDYLCLPRPKSPPLHRITMSHYTAQEYGCPSSHSANAIGVSLVVLLHCFNNANTIYDMIIPIFLLLLYCSSLIFGRIYCGMHGFTDIIIGSGVGSLVFIIRYKSHDLWDSIIFNHESQYTVLTPLLLCIFYYTLVYLHPKPLEDCPCYEDSVAFIGVLLGLEIGQHLLTLSMDKDLAIWIRCVIPYSYEELGLFKSALRILLGVLLILIWKNTSKKAFSLLLSSCLQKSDVECWAFKSRKSLDIVVRLIVYGGIAIIAAFSGVAFNIVGLGCEFKIEHYI